jgi:hypothetical protein
MNLFFAEGLSEGTHDWTIECFDNLTFAQEETGVRNLTVDLADPVVSLENPLDAAFYQSNAVAFNFTPSDDHLGNCTLFGNFSGSFSSNETEIALVSGAVNNVTITVADGAYSWNVVCFDKAGRFSSGDANFSVDVDAAGPGLEGISAYPASGAAYAPSQTHWFNITVVEPFPSAVVFEHNFSGSRQNETSTAVPGRNFSFSRLSLPAGSYAIRWYANDTLSRENVSALQGYVVAKASSQVLLYLNGSTANFSTQINKHVNVTAVLQSPPSGALEVFQNGSLIDQGATPVYADVFFTSPGMYELNASYAGDENYTAGAVVRAVTVADNIAPVVLLMSPGDGLTVGTADVSFSYNVSDASELVNCSLWVDGVYREVDDSVNTGTEESFSLTLANGTYDWYVRCYDAYANVGESETFSFTLAESSTLGVFTESNRSEVQQGMFAGIETNVTDGLGTFVNGTVTTDIVSGNATVRWWDVDWQYRKQVFIGENLSEDLQDVLVDVNVTGIDVSNCTKEIRVVKNVSQETYVLNATVIGGNDADYCVVRFLANVSAGSSAQGNYMVYYGNAGASAPGFSVTERPVVVQSGYATVSGAQPEMTISPVDTSHAFILFTANLNSSLPDRNQFLPSFSAANKVKFERYTGLTDANISFQVVESPDIIVQAGSEMLSEGDVGLNISISPVDVGNAFIIVYGRANNATAPSNNHGFFRAMFVDEDTIWVERKAIGSNAEFAYQVVEWKGSRVIGVNGSFGTVGNDFSIASVNLARTFVIGSAAVTGNNNVQANFVRFNLSSATVLHAERVAAAGTASISAFAVEMPPGTVVQYNATTITDDTSVAVQQTQTNRSFHVQSWSTTGGNTAYVNGMLLVNLSSPTLLSIDKQSAAQTNVLLSYVVNATRLSVANTSVGPMQEFVRRFTNATGSSGRITFSWNSSNNSLGYYSAVALAERFGFRNGSDSVSFQVVPDTSGPAVSIVDPANNSIVHSTSVEVNLSVSDFSQARLENCSLYGNVSGQFQLLNSTSAVPQVEKTPLGVSQVEDGVYVFGVECYDQEGNRNLSENITLNVSVDGPLIEAVMFNATVANQSEAVQFQANISDQYNVTAGYVVLQRPDASVQNLSLSRIGNLSFASVSNTTLVGEYLVLTVAAANALGKMTVVTDAGASFLVIASPPSFFDLHAPSNGTNQSNMTPTFMWEAVEEHDFANYSLFIADNEGFLSPSIHATYAISGTVYSLSSPLEVDTLYYWKVIAFDNFGNSRSSQVFQYGTYNAYPSVELLRPLQGDADPDRNVTFVFASYDENLQNCSLFTNQSGVFVAQAQGSVVEGVNAFALNNLAAGSLLWAVVCEDSEGLRRFSENRSVLIGSNDTNHLNITVDTVLAVNMTPPIFQGFTNVSTVNLVAGRRGYANFTLVASDDNGWGDIALVNATIYHFGNTTLTAEDNETNHYSTDCTYINSSAVAVNVSCSFQVQFFANNGTWTIAVGIFDAEGLNASGSANFTINPLFAVDVNMTFLSYGNRATFETSSEVALQVSNAGNVRVNLTAYGYGAGEGDDLAFVCPAGSISIANERFGNVSGLAFSQMTPLSGIAAGPSVINATIPKTETNASNRTADVFWRLYIPENAYGLCNGTIRLGSVIA